MNVNKEILNLINTQDFIVLPGIGAFISEYSKPYFNEDGEVILPVKSTTFENVILKDPENKLIKLLSDRLNIPESYALIQYQDFLKDFRKEILLKNKYDWEELGLFFKNDKGLLDFYIEKVTPKINASFVEPQSSPKIAQDVFKPEPKPEKVIVPIIKETDNIEENHSTKKFSLSKALIFVVPILLLTYGLAYTIFKDKKEKAPSSTLIQQIDSLEKVNDSISIPAVAEPITKRNSTSNLVEEKSTRVSSSSENDNSIDREENHIISIGIFKVRENVDNLATYLAENGIPAKVRPYGKRYKVFVSATSESQALEIVDKIEQLTGERPVYEK